MSGVGRSGTPRFPNRGESIAVRADDMLLWLDTSGGVGDVEGETGGEIRGGMRLSPPVVLGEDGGEPEEAEAIEADPVAEAARPTLPAKFFSPKGNLGKRCRADNAVAGCSVIIGSAKICVFVRLRASRLPDESSTPERPSTHQSDRLTAKPPTQPSGWPEAKGVRVRTSANNSMRYMGAVLNV